MEPGQDLGEFEMPFGKYKGEELQVIYLSDKGYLHWIVKSFSNNSEVRDVVEEFLEEKE